MSEAVPAGAGESLPAASSGRQAAEPADSVEAPSQPGAKGLEDMHGLVRDCAASGVGRRVLLLRTDLLPPRLARPHHLRLAREALAPLMAAERARTYDLPAGRLAVSWRGSAPVLFQQATGALEHLFGGGVGPTSVTDLVRVFDLPRDGAALLAAAGRADRAEITPSRRTVPAAPLPVLLPLDASVLAAMERGLAAADMARFARRKPVCRLDGGHVRLAWEKRCLSVAELTDTLAPGRSAQADAWLFRRLTRVLDRRMLAMLSAPRELFGAGPFSLNLNVSSVLSPEFLRFDSVLPAALRGRVVLEMQPADVLADPAAFAFARGFARARGYRLLLRGVTAALLPLLCLPRMELDFVRLRWSPDLLAIDPAALDAGPAQWVLGRADDPAALRWGQDAGIALFAGRAAAVTA